MKMAKNESAIFPPILREAESALHEIFYEDRAADRAIEFRLKNQKKWGARDRKQFAELVYDSVRWWRKAWAMLRTQPAAAKISLVLELVAEKEVNADWVPKLSDAENLSIPDWLQEMGRESFRNEWPEVMSALNEKAPQDLRANSMLGTAPDLQKKLRGDDIETKRIDDVPTGLTLTVRKNVFQTDFFKNGYFEMQDRSSQRVGPALDPQPGERILDACAGAGGKTLHLAALMKNKGRIVACDIHDWKLKELRRRSSRARADLIELKLLPDAKWLKRNEKKFDRVLLDVPCTGLGVLRRNPDAKWKMKPERIAEILKIQRDLLDEFSPLLKAGGRLVYSTCSLFPFENHSQILDFQKRSPQKFEVVAEETFRPDTTGGDGFFIACLKSLS